MARILAIPIALAWSSMAGAGAKAPDDVIRWRTRLVVEHRDFVGVWVDTRQLAAGHSIRDVSAQVSCLDARAMPVGSESFPVTDGARPELSRGVVYLRYFRHGCPDARKIAGITLHYTETRPGGSPAPGRVATLRTDRIRVPSRQVELIGASPFRTTDPSAYCTTPPTGSAEAKAESPPQR